jgi:hypothetical protein
MEHVSHVFMLIFAVVAWIVNSVINHPEFFEFRVEVNTVDQTNASDDTVFIATELAMNERDFSGMVFIEHGVVKNQVPVGADHDFVFALLLDLVGFNVISSQVARGRIVAEALVMLGEVRQCVIGSAHQQELAVIVAVDEATHGSVSLRIGLFRLYCVSPNLTVRSRCFDAIHARKICSEYWIGMLENLLRKSVPNSQTRLIVHGNHSRPQPVP